LLTSLAFALDGIPATYYFIYWTPLDICLYIVGVEIYYL